MRSFAQLIVRGEGGSFIVRDVGAGFTSASRDAVWIQTPAADSAGTSILRVAFDAANGRFASRGEVVYTGDTGGTPTIFSVTEKGDTMVVNEASTGFVGWRYQLKDAFQGTLAKDKQLLRSENAPLCLRLSPDGQRVLIMRPVRSTSGSRTLWTVAPFAGRPEAPLISSGASIDDARWASSSTVRLKEHSQAGVQLSLLNLETHERSATLSLPADAKIADFVSLSDGSWAWISTWGLTVFVQHPHDKAPRQLLIPGFAGTLAMDVSTDGARLAIFGWMEPAVDGMIGVSVMSMPDGRVTRWWASTHYDEPGRVFWGRDGSVFWSFWKRPALCLCSACTAPAR